MLQGKHREKKRSSAIKKFKQKKLKDLFENGKSAKIGRSLQTKILLILDIINGTCAPEDANFPGSRFHTLKETLKDFIAFRSRGIGESSSVSRTETPTMLN